jgi:hypothetical protein
VPPTSSSVSSAFLSLNSFLFLFRRRSRTIATIISRANPTAKKTMPAIAPARRWNADAASLVLGLDTTELVDPGPAVPVSVWDGPPEVNPSVVEAVAPSVVVMGLTELVPLADV